MRSIVASDQASILRGADMTARRWVGQPPGIAVLREVAVPLVLLVLWQVAGHQSMTSADLALERAAWIHHTEAEFGLPDEAAWQRAALPHTSLLMAANSYYAVIHVATMAGLLLWVYVRYREHYRRVRGTVTLVTATCLLMQFIPVAPPRILRQDGFVDVAAEHGQSIFGRPVAGLVVNEFAAMPSMHVAWCVLVAAVAARIASSGWRWLGVIHAAVTLVVVVVTANHFWADCVMAVMVVLMGYTAQASIAAARRRRGRAAASPDQVTAMESGNG
ncbi:phosphatase PAP2 family protein [Streptomyces sp. NPDC006446]|uniref:phosphatase PAP2 family protein n=1 Tax=Streptomyces sp. NPDC006446 TaxID=3154301 RepID=UPI0033A768D6